MIKIKVSPNNPPRKEIEAAIHMKGGVVEFLTTRGQVLQLHPTECVELSGTNQLRIKGTNPKVDDSRVGNMVGHAIVVTYNERERGPGSAVLE